MSWSVNYIGTPEKILAAMDDLSTKLNGQSKLEFDEALPHLKALVSSNVGSQTGFWLIANGHATITEGVKTYGYLSVDLKQVGDLL